MLSSILVLTDVNANPNANLTLGKYLSFFQKTNKCEIMIDDAEF